MKQMILLIFTLGMTGYIHAQSIEIKGFYAYTNSNKFTPAMGYGIGYTHKTKVKQRLGLSLSYFISKPSYHQEYKSLEDGISYYIQNVEAYNQRFAIKIHYAFGLLKSNTLQLYIAPQIGLNYYIMEENIDQEANGSIWEKHYTCHYKKKHRLSFGVLCELAWQPKFTKHLGAFLALNPEISGFEAFGTRGSYAPWFIRWVNIGVGLRYNFCPIEK